MTGGAGYIGSHACKALKRAGYTPVTVDNFSTGWRDAVKFGPLVEADLLHRAALDQAFKDYKPEAVMHFAALSQVGESVTDPGKYWRNNVGGSLNLIEAAASAKCKKFIFSSTCATYGEHDGVLITEETPQNPTNAYGASKLAVEQMLKNFEASHGFKSIMFRYFNVAGADPEGEIGECHEPETHLIPLAIRSAMGLRRPLKINGTDYATPDGTCVRDYVHVTDLVEAHILGLKWLQGGKLSRVFNLGSGWGYSVREVVDAVAEAAERSVPTLEGPRRAGDCASLVSGSEVATLELGWRQRHGSLSDIIGHAHAWETSQQIDTQMRAAGA
ncbi:UDP-glucose 4-epimerase GalE [Planktomarina temperata]|nr:UDP-glucose 4-epimerase GalE [Planktomarina temperata]